MKKILVGLIFLTGTLFAHTAIMNCFDNADSTVTCEGGFSDGSSASGVKFYILQGEKKVLNTKFSADSEVTFKKPKGEYTAQFDAGEGHKVFIKSSDIFE